MTLTFNASDLNELDEHRVVCPNNMVLDEFEDLVGIPEILGRGYSRQLELIRGVYLSFMEWQCTQDHQVIAPAHEHLIQIGIWLRGACECSIHPTFHQSLSYFSGSGISPSYVENYRSGEIVSYLNIEIEPQVMESIVLSDRERESPVIKQLFKKEDWKMSFYPKVTPPMKMLAHQMQNPPYHGLAKRMYLQAKVWELLGMLIDSLAADQSSVTANPKLRKDTLASLYQVKDILDNQLDNPPTIGELAGQVEISERTLIRGFKQLFGATVVHYSIQQRLKRAKSLLLQGNSTVAEVANLVGYTHLGYFAAAFKAQFGITPIQYQAGLKINN